MGGYHLGMMLLLIVMPWRWPQPKFNWPPYLWLLVAGSLGSSLLAGVLVFSLWPWLAKPAAQALAPFLSTWALDAPSWAIFVWYFCLINPWLEELYWRHWLSQTDHSIWETTIWFAGYHGLVLWPLIHWWWVILVLIILAIVGWWWSQLSRWGTGLLGPIACHLVADVSIMLAVNRLYNLG